MILKIYIIIYFLLFFQVNKSHSQEIENKKENKIEFLMNISNAISRFAGNGPLMKVDEEPFLFGMKYKVNESKGAIRLGLNMLYKRTNDNLNSTPRSTIDNSWSPLLGYEFRKPLGNKFEFYWGADVRYYNLSSKTDTRTNSNPVIYTYSSYKSNGFGAGPFCGITFKINEFISLQTEGNLYFNQVKVLRELRINSDPTEVLENKIVNSLSPVAPSSILFVIKF